MLSTYGSIASSPYADLAFTDEEVIGSYLWGVMNKRPAIKDIYENARRYLHAGYPQLPSYAGYVQRLNRVAGVFGPLLAMLQAAFPDSRVQRDIRLMDAMPIATSSLSYTGFSCTWIKPMPMRC